MKEFARKLQFVLMLALMSMPPVLMLGMNAFEEKLWLCAVFPAIYAAMASLCLLIKGRKRLLAGAGLSVIFIAASLALLPWRETWWTLALSVGYVFLLLLGLPMSGWPYDQELPLNVCVAGLGIYVLAQFMVMFKPDLYAPVTPALLGSFLAYGALWMLMLNRQSLTDAAAKGRRAPLAMRRKNLMLTISLMAVVLLISGIPALARALKWAWDRLLELIVAIGRFLSALLPEQTAGGGGGGGEPSAMLGEAAEPSLLSQILEQIFAALTIIALAALLFVGLRIVWRKLRVILRRLWALLNRYALAASEDYVDEVADTRGMGGETSSARRNLFGDWFRQVNEERMSPVERIRYRYRRLLRKRMDWQPGSTARENIPQDAAVIYERARYSTQEVSAQEAEAFAAGVQGMEKSAKRS